MELELPRGITGVGHKDDPTLPDCDLAAFRRHCRAAARALNGRVVDMEAPFRGTVTNFARVVLELPTGRVAVLLNAHFPVVAFAEPPVEGELSMRFIFIDAPGLAEVFRNFEIYEVVSVSELAAPLTSERCQRLAAAERKHMEYWRPECVGEVVFNFWD
jgi:hypothetical protein